AIHGRGSQCRSYFVPSLAEDNRERRVSSRQTIFYFELNQEENQILRMMESLDHRGLSLPQGRLLRVKTRLPHRLLDRCASGKGRAHRSATSTAFLRPRS